MNFISQTPPIDLPMETLLLLVFYFILASYVIFTAIFYYHWTNYSTDTKVTGLTFFLYFATTLPLLAVMGVMTVII
ncbi:hypothetical protein KC865_00140 [Candidatus Kaiserbacteria bacterium]|nr:hypothetical protein [Candidatus Kaiserbacteria bacterium]USN91915.1 MAG: hypothetical protein H6782_03505 [Candidatus Nomurabacteria bacterium]